MTFYKIHILAKALTVTTVTTVDTYFILYKKKSSIAKYFFDICNAEMAQSLSSLQKKFLKLITLQAPLQPAVCILFTPVLKAKNVFLRSFFL